MLVQETVLNAYEKIESWNLSTDIWIKMEEKIRQKHFGVDHLWPEEEEGGKKILKELPARPFQFPFCMQLCLRAFGVPSHIHHGSYARTWVNNIFNNALIV